MYTFPYRVLHIFIYTVMYTFVYLDMYTFMYTYSYVVEVKRIISFHIKKESRILKRKSYTNSEALECSKSDAYLMLSDLETIAAGQI